MNKPPTTQLKAVNNWRRSHLYSSQRTPASHTASLIHLRYPEDNQLLVCSGLHDLLYSVTQVHVHRVAQYTGVWTSSLENILKVHILHTSARVMNCVILSKELYLCSVLTQVFLNKSIPCVDFCGQERK